MNTGTGARFHGGRGIRQPRGCVDGRDARGGRPRGARIIKVYAIWIVHVEHGATDILAHTNIHSPINKTSHTRLD